MYEECAIIEWLVLELDVFGLLLSNDCIGSDGVGNLYVWFLGSWLDLLLIMLCVYTDMVELGRGVKLVFWDGVIRMDG